MVFQICDFGLARIWENRNEDGMALTPEVVTEYYRSPELLMGSTKYNEAIDVWSIGCIFAELLGRRILFLANGPLEQVRLWDHFFGALSIRGLRPICPWVHGALWIANAQMSILHTKIICSSVGMRITP